MLKLFFVSTFFILFLTSCSTYKNVSDSNNFKSFVKGFSGSNNFHSLVEDLVEKVDARLNKYLINDEAVLVSDFVNLDNLTNHSKLGFLMSDHLKNSLSSRSIIVKQVELGKDFELGEHGFNLLTRKQEKIANKEISSNYAIVGTYTLTTESLIVFIKLIEINSGNILASSSGRTPIDQEIRELERTDKKKKPFVVSPLVL